MSKKQIVTTDDLVGEIRDFPLLVVQLMCEEQELQGNNFDPSVFAKCKEACSTYAGFSWGNSRQGWDAWNNFISHSNIKCLEAWCKENDWSFDCAENPKPVEHPHAKLMKIYAEDATKTRRPWELWEYKNKDAKSWIPCDSSPSWFETLDYRHKQKMIKVGNFEFPEPVREINAYNKFDTIYVLSFAGDCFSVNETVSYKYEWEELIVKGGFVHLTLEAAEKHAEVLSKICKGEV